MIENILLLAGIGLISYAIFKWITLNNDYFVKRGIPHIKPYPVFGNTFGLFSRQYSMYDFIQNMYKSSPAKIFGLFDLRKPFFMVRDPEVLKQLTIKDFDHFEDHRSFIDEDIDRMFGKSLFMLRGSKWRDMRATLSPAFTGSKMRQMFELVTECAVDVSNNLKAKASDNNNHVYVEMKDIYQRYANDVIASTAFGVRTNSLDNPNNDFIVAGKTFLNLNNPINTIKILLLRAIPSIMKYLDIELTPKKVGAFFSSMVFDNMKIREAEGIFRPDMINILMQVKRGETASKSSNQQEEDISTDGFATVEESSIGKLTVKRTWTDDEIAAQCFLFFIAGFDTASTGLAFLSYELALNPNIQAKLYDEIKETNASLNGKTIGYDTIQKMKYMDLVITESLRKWPPAPFTDRLCVKDYNYDDGELNFTIEKGTAFWIPIYAIHHDAKYFPNPDKFDPERFNDDNKDSIAQGTYIPFGIGPRNCIGSRFALMEIKAVMYYLLLNFEICSYSKTQIPVQLEKSAFGVHSEKGIHLEFKLRK